MKSIAVEFRARRHVTRALVFSALIGLLVVAGAKHVRASDPNPANILIEINSDTTPTVFCEATDDSGFIRAKASKIGVKGVQATVVVNGSSSHVNGRVSCGSDCNSKGCLPRWRRTDIETAVNSSTSTRLCGVSEIYKQHGCEIWSAREFYQGQESIVNFWLGPVGSAFETVNMNTSTRSNIISMKRGGGEGFPSCGPLGC